VSQIELWASTYYTAACRHWTPYPQGCPECFAAEMRSDLSDETS